MVNGSTCRSLAAARDCIARVIGHRIRSEDLLVCGSAEGDDRLQVS
jgi:hypothetical protein